MQNVISNLTVSESEFMKIYDFVRNIKCKKSNVTNISIINIRKICIWLNWNFFLDKKIHCQNMLEYIHNNFPEILHNGYKLSNKWHPSMDILFSRWNFDDIYDFLVSVEITEENYELFIIQDNLDFIYEFIHTKLDYENYQKENETVLDKMWDECKEMKTENENTFEILKSTEKDNEKLNQELALIMRENLMLKEELKNMIQEYKKLDVNYRKRCAENLMLETKLHLLNENYKMQTNEMMLILEKNESLLDENEELYEKLCNEKNNCFKLNFFK